MMDYVKFYDLHSYLFSEVSPRFQEQHYLTAFDFFCIVIWKANRAKSKIATRLLHKSGCDTLDSAVRLLTEGIYSQPTSKARLRYLFEEWGFRLPMATAILTVLFPDEFTVYDSRVCEILGEFQGMSYISNFDSLWASYEDFKQRVIESTPTTLSLRDKDRYLWGKSFCDQLNHDIAQNFNHL